MHKALHIRRDLLVCLIVMVTTLAAYWDVRNHDFLHYDDSLYVTENSHVRAGLTWAGIIWAFTTTHASNWHPLTWLTHMVACEIYGLDAGGHHVTSLLFHIVNTVLLFMVLNRMTRALWGSAFVAALFAVHPLHVESVAWVAERKDVLSTFFLFATMWAYVHYAECPGFTRYLLVLVLFAFGLMAKPMIVTLPFVLLLMDYWPLGRFGFGYSKQGLPKSVDLRHKISSPLHLVFEKVPLIGLAAGSCVVTFLAQQSGGSLPSLDKLPLNIRIANALVSYISYIGKTIWPAQLTVFYPHPGMPPLWKMFACTAFLLVVTLLVILTWKKRPYLAVGWLWYLGTLVPVIGLVQVGEQAMADRYTYVPLIGLFVMVVWGVPELGARWRYQRHMLATSMGVALSCLVICTYSQVRHWDNATALFKHAVDVTTENYVAHFNLGFALAKQGRTKEAIRHYSEALRINPAWAEAHNILGNALARQGNLRVAVSHYSEALRIKPAMAETHNNLGLALQMLGRLEEAVPHFRQALRIKPDYTQARHNLETALAALKKID
ncbi:MAG: tetratricopeptide repeat protein [Desulfobacterales bacterium]|nr:MAG: tetratricopeptide repeat protein [Desulfobacterales bacterium]